MIVLIVLGSWLCLIILEKRNEIKKSLQGQEQYLDEQRIKYAGLKAYVVTDNLGPAKLYEIAGGYGYLDEIPINEKFELLDLKSIHKGQQTVTWYKIKYDSKEGWISQFVTTGKIISEKN